MAYLNLALDYFEHPKVKRLVAILGEGAEMLPLRLWCYCGKFHSKDGRFAGYGDQEIAALAGWRGEASAMLSAMAKVVFMQKRGQVWEMHDWKEHNGHIEALKERAKNAANARWDRLKAKDAASNANASDKALHDECPSQPASQPDRPKRKKGGEKEKGGGAAPGRFPVPDFAPLPSPLYAKTAEAMIVACDQQILAIKKSARTTPVKEQTLEGTEYVARHELEPDAKEAIRQWTERKRQINKALAG